MTTEPTKKYRKRVSEADVERGADIIYKMRYFATDEKVTVAKKSKTPGYQDALEQSKAVLEAHAEVIEVDTVSKMQEDSEINIFMKNGEWLQYKTIEQFHAEWEEVLS
jgi:hypothetical protein